MIGKIINYGTDQLLPDKYKFIGDYACATIDAASGDYASSAVLVVEGISENLKQTDNTKAATTAEITGVAASAAGGDINNAIKTGAQSSIISAGARMGAVGTAAGIGASKKGENGAKIGASIATGSIGKDINETAIKSSMSATGMALGYKIKGEKGIQQGASLGSNSAKLGLDSYEIIDKNQTDLESARIIKNDIFNTGRDVKSLTEKEPHSKKEFQKKIKEDHILNLTQSSSDAIITSSQIASDEPKGEEAELEMKLRLASELGQSASTVCKIKERKIEIEDKRYKITDTLCYTMGNYRDIKYDIDNLSEAVNIKRNKTTENNKAKIAPDRH